MKDVIDVEPVPQQGNQTMAVQRSEAGAVARPMTVDELHRNLEFIREVMRKEMKEGTDYGKIPGTGDRKTLLQPGAQKLLMTFNLQEEVKKEVLREFPGMHREYEFTITVIAANGKRWDGVGTCTTLESKYRYRKAERKCPRCGKESIIQGKAEFGGGWVCWKKKGGCDAKFPDNEPGIISQAGGVVENEDPADVWNTCRKMAFKRGLVAAAINATNTSELWTQDMEDLNQNDEMQKEKAAAKLRKNENRAQTGVEASGGVSTSTPRAQSAGNPATQSAPVAKQATPDPKPWPLTPKAREWLIEKRLSKSEIGHAIALDFFRKAGMILPTEQLTDLPVSWLPLNSKELELLEKAIVNFGAGGDAEKPYQCHDMPGESRAKPAAAPPPPKTEPVVSRVAPNSPLRAAAEAVEAAAPEPTPRQTSPPVEAAKQKDPEWWRGIIVPIPHKGEKRADYLRNPDTIGSLYDQMKSGNEAAGKRLWGFASHFEAKPWQGNDGKMRPASETDLAFRDALDAFVEWEEKYGKDTQAPANEEEGKTPWD